jgi:hypothetical protein
MRESKIEKDDVKAVEESGGISYKFESPGTNGVPDRLILKNIPPRLRKLISKYVYFIEYKAPGKKPRPSQIREHKRIRKRGFEVKIIDTLQKD